MQTVGHLNGFLMNKRMATTTSKSKPTIKLLLSALLLLLSLWCRAQSQLPIIKVTNGTVFTRQSAIKYSVMCSQKCYYYISLETLLNGRWREIMLDISLKAPSKAAVLRKAAGEELRYGKFPVQLVPVAYLQGKGMFRFKLTYGLSPAAMNKVVLSDKFSIE